MLRKKKTLLHEYILDELEKASKMHGESTIITSVRAALVTRFIRCLEMMEDYEEKKYHREIAMRLKHFHNELNLERAEKARIASIIENMQKL